MAPDGTTQPLTQQSVRAGNFNVSVNGTTLNEDGGWDLATRFTNLSGTVSDRTFTDAIVIATPQPEVHVVAPTADDPRTVPFYENRAVPVRFTKNGPGRIEFAVRKSGTNDQFVVVNDIPFTQPSRDRSPGSSTPGRWPHRGSPPASTTCGWRSSTLAANGPKTSHPGPSSATTTLRPSG
jgi:hypothetical protein